MVFSNVLFCVSRNLNFRELKNKENSVNFEGKFRYFERRIFKNIFYLCIGEPNFRFWCMTKTSMITYRVNGFSEYKSAGKSKSQRKIFFKNKTMSCERKISYDEKS